MNNEPKKEHPQAENPEQPTRATDPQASEISGNVFEGLVNGLSEAPEDRKQVREDKPLEDLPQTRPEGE